MKYFCEKLNHNWSHCNEGLSVASVFFVKGAVTWLYSTDKLKDLPETTEQKSTGLILVIASRHIKESWWVFSRVFHLFSMKWQLTRQLISINWRLISESCLVCRRCNWNNYGPITVHPLVGESFSRVGSIQRNITSLKLVLALVNGIVISLSVCRIPNSFVLTVRTLFSLLSCHFWTLWTVALTDPL